MFDVLIIGAGVIGCSIARELSRFSLKTCILEKGSDVATGTSKANSGIVHAGYDAKNGSLKAVMNIKGNRMFDKLSKELDFLFKRNGSLTVAFRTEEVPVLEQLLSNGVKNGVPALVILSGEALFQAEPGLNRSAVAALYAPESGITCPYDMTWAMAENAVQNGVQLFLQQEVLSVQKGFEGFEIKTKTHTFHSRFVINCAGVNADEISRMAGAEAFTIAPRKGEYCIMDKEDGGRVYHTLFTVPGKMGKGVLVSPTVDGNIIVGPNAADIEDKGDVATTAEGLSDVLAGCLKLVPSFPANHVITSFAGLRAISGEDFIIDASPKVPGFVQVAGISSPGLTAAPAISEYVRDILSDHGLALRIKDDFNPIRKGIARFKDMNARKRAQKINENPLYGKIVCRCEMITEAEILEAIRRPCGASNLDAVKRRIRAGMGRCQGGFCSSHIVELLSKELNILKTRVTKNGGESVLLTDKIR